MRLLAEWTIRHGGVDRRIELCHGDLAALPPEHAVDVLVVSAFPNDYTPTPASLIGALHRAGVSVADLARTKASDMREEFSCWMSAPLPETFPARRILCIESGWRGAPPETADDVFRAIAPCSVSEYHEGTVAMPLIGAGDQGYLPEQMLECIVKDAVAWFRRGLHVRTLKIVVRSDELAARATAKFLELQRLDRDAAAQAPPGAMPEHSDNACDVFLSYAHENVEAASRIHQELQQARPELRIFFDRKTLAPGASWLTDIADSLDAARRVVALYTPEYWKSKYCKDEFNAAYIRQNDTGESLLFPIFFQNVHIPYLFRTVQFTDCRESDVERMASACRQLSTDLAALA